MLQDVRHAVRLMGRQKAFTAAALLTLGLGIGATTAMFSIVYGVLLRPLPYPAAERLVRLSEEHPGGVTLVRSPMLSNSTYFAWLETSRTLEGLAPYSSGEYTLSAGEPRRVSGGAASPALFRLLDARPLLGRLLHDDDALAGAPKVVVLAYGLWRDLFGSDATVIGRTVRLDGTPHTIVGIMRPEFHFPTRGVRLWIPYRVPKPDEDGSRPFWGFWAFGRLRPGVTPEQAAAEGTAAARSAGPRPMAADLVLGKGGLVVVRAEPLLDQMTARVRPALLALLVSVTLVLFIACANVANLLLSRGIWRRRELAVRAALGAGRLRLVGQMVTEALVLALFGGALGLGLGWMLTLAVPALAPEDFPRIADIRLDGAALACAAAASIASGVLAGVVPTWRVNRDALLTGLRDGAGASSGAHTRRLGTMLLVAETTIAVMLLVAAGLLGRSFVRLVHVDPGYDVEHVLMARVHLQRDDGGGDREEQFAERLADRLRALPGVAAAGVGNMAPFIGITAASTVTLRGDSARPITARVLSYVVTPGYAEALGLRLVQGRMFEARDMSSGVRPIIVNEEFVRVHLSDGRPSVGRRFTQSIPSDLTVEIIGVIGNVLKDGLDTQPQPEMYNLPRDAYGFPASLNIAVRTPGEPLALVSGVRQVVREVDSRAAVDAVETLGSRVVASVSEPRFATAVLAAFASVALALSALGLYGVLSYHVLQRRRELGVRAALGATRASLIGLVMREGLQVAAAGAALGLIGASWFSRLLQTLLFGIDPHDQLVFGAAPAALFVVAVAATFIAARRAASADPIEVLRSE